MADSSLSMAPICSVILFLYLCCPCHCQMDDVMEHRPWGYFDSSDTTHGPRDWKLNFSNCGRNDQSPIHLQAPILTYKTSHISLANPETRIGIINTGESVAITCARGITMTGGDLPGTFVITDMHFHWSQKNEGAGSEHWLDGRQYPIEMHIVSYNSKYGSYVNARGKQDGVHVMAIFFQLSYSENKGLRRFIRKLSEVREVGSEDRTYGSLDLQRVLPSSSTHFYRYNGSTTTPPCHEHVIWTVFASPQPISRYQLNEFRKVKLDVDLDTSIGANVRPLQPRNNRQIYLITP